MDVNFGIVSVFGAFFVIVLVTLVAVAWHIWRDTCNVPLLCTNMGHRAEVHVEHDKNGACLVKLCQCGRTPMANFTDRRKARDEARLIEKAASMGEVPIGYLKHVVLNVSIPDD
jgi:hypothetical protein